MSFNLLIQYLCNDFKYNMQTNLKKLLRRNQSILEGGEENLKEIKNLRSVFHVYIIKNVQFLLSFSIFLEFVSREMYPHFQHPLNLHKIKARMERTLPSLFLAISLRLMMDG